MLKENYYKYEVGTLEGRRGRNNLVTGQTSA